MGAIAVYLPESGPAQPDVVRAMSAAAPHRGTHVEALVHGRCAIACANDDIRDAVIGTAAGLAVVFVGSLDNAQELARHLEVADLRPTADDASFGCLPVVLAAGFRRFGEDLPAHLRGVFAGAISDGEQVFCFRDHIGYRPLFYRRGRARFYAATEAKQVVAGSGIPKEPDLEVAERILYRNTSDDTPAALKGVLRLPKATSITAGSSAARPRRYWRPESLLETARLSTHELQDRFVGLMERAVARSLSGPDAISLSGGVDSPAIAAFAAPKHLEMFGTPLQAISVVYPKYPSVDESRYVTMLATYFRIPLHTYEQTANSMAGLDRWTALADTPFPGASLAQYEEDYLHARALGFRTLLSGEHAEFVFAFQWSRLDHFLTHGRFSAARRMLAERRARGDSWLSLVRLVARSIAPDRVLSARNALGSGTLQPPFPPGSIGTRPLTRIRSRSGSAGGGRSLLASSALVSPSRPKRSARRCAASTTAGRGPTSTCRSPSSASLPSEKFPGDRMKGLVRDLLRGRVPDEILDRQDKTVFDEAALADIDYMTLRRYLIAPSHRVDGVDYARLAVLLEAQKLTRIDYVWARELAGIHAFLSQW